MNTPGLDYVAIDFETATSERYSICSVGIVTVTGGIIMEKYFSLIQPPKNEYTNICISIHGITPNNTINAPTFPEIYPEIKRRLINKIVIAHNAKSVEYNYLTQAMQLYNINDELNITWIDTLDIDHRSLNVICEELNIPLIHHDPLSDALACAELYKINIQGKNYKPKTFDSNNKCDTQQYYKREHKLLNPEFDHEDNPFIGKKIVVSGNFITWPSRDDLCDLLEILGARISSSVSKATNILIVGLQAGDKKIEQMNENINNGKDAMILNENGIIELLSLCGFEYNLVDLPIQDKNSFTETITLQQHIKAWHDKHDEQWKPYNSDI